MNSFFQMQQKFYKQTLTLTMVAAALLCSPANSMADSHGIAHHAKTKYDKNFTHFEYANPNAPKGGRLTLSSIGGFDTLNPFALKGDAPFMIGALVFETITSRSLDEPFAQYGLLSKSLEVAKDSMSVTYNLDKNATFSDGSPVNSEDIKFTFNKLTSEEATPLYRYYYKDIKQVDILGPKKVKFVFSIFNPELKLIIGELPVLSKAFYSTGAFSSYKKTALGSGPYIIADFKLGKYILYKRNPDYWGINKPVNKGKFNFDEIMVKYYKSRVTQIEGLKAGEFDFLAVSSSKDWAKALNGENFTNNKIKKVLLPHSNNAGMQGFAMNLRNPIFSDIKTRHALAISLDFEWSNKNLFYGQYKAYSSYFAGSDLAATALPSKEELKILIPLKKNLPESIFTVPMQPAGAEFKDNRSRLRAAKKLLKEAGWIMKDKKLVNSDGKQLKFTMLLSNTGFSRIVEPWFKNLNKLGIEADYDVKDPSIYIERVQKHDWDVIVQSYGQSQSPGNEQREYWHSETADTEGSRNHMGIKNPAIDKLIDLIIQAPGRKELVTITHALDRALWHGYYMVPNWYIDKFRVTYKNRFGMPDKLPKYYGANSLVLFWWADTDKENKLNATN